MKKVVISIAIYVIFLSICAVAEASHSAGSTLKQRLSALSQLDQRKLFDPGSSSSTTSLTPPPSIIANFTSAPKKIRDNCCPDMTQCQCAGITAVIAGAVLGGGYLSYSILGQIFCILPTTEPWCI